MVQQLGFATGPGTIGYNTINGDMLFRGGTGMKIIQTHGFIKEKGIKINITGGGTGNKTGGKYQNEKY